MKGGYDSKDLVSGAVQVVRIVHRLIQQRMRDPYDRAHSLAKIRLETAGRPKWALRVDDSAEQRRRDEFRVGLGNSITVIGEESLPEDLTTLAPHRLYALVDMVDGTNLLEMDIPMWCSAIVIFETTPPWILGSVVGLATGEIYFATEGSGRPQVSREPSADLTAVPTHVPLPGPSDVSTLGEATISFYGQKATNLLAVTSVGGLKERLTQLSGIDDVPLRIHTLAGNPMMVKLADRERAAPSGRSSGAELTSCLTSPVNTNMVLSEALSSQSRRELSFTR